MFKFLPLALAAAAAALPAGAPQEPKSNEFVTYMTVQNGIQITLNAMRNGTDDHFVLVGERPSAYPGTPTQTRRTFDTAGEALFFDVGGELYGWKTVDAGHVDGNINPVTAVKDYAEFKFHTNEHYITHDFSAVQSGFFACDSVINGVQLSVLSWGNDAAFGAKMPEGCVKTNVTKSIAKDQLPSGN